MFATSNVSPDQIELCRDRARQMYQEFAGALQYTYITPIDSEDMQRLVLRFLHLLDILGDCTHVLASMPNTPRELGPVREKVIGCAAALADSVDAMAAGTSLVEPTSALWEQQRSAYLQWRQWRTGVRNRNLGPVEMLQMDTLLRPLARLIREFRQAAVDIREVKLKNG
jgi:hypothetical protein